MRLLYTHKNETVIGIMAHIIIIRNNERLSGSFPTHAKPESGQYGGKKEGLRVTICGRQMEIPGES